MSDHGCEAVVELAAELLNLFGVARKLLLLPAVGDGFQERQQRHWRRRNHAKACRLLEKVSVLFERRREQRLERQEHDDEFGRRLELLPIFLGAEVPNVI